MGKKLIYILLASLLFSFISCTENNVTNVVGFDKTLVLISDNALESELMIDITGAIKSEYPNIEIVHIKNKSFDIFEAGYLLDLTSKSYPSDTYFAVIVEPGTKSKRIVFDAGERLVIAPDNGLSSMMRQTIAPKSIYYIDNLEIFEGQYSNIDEVPFQVFYREAILKMLSGDPTPTFGSICTSPVEIKIESPKFENNITSGQINLVDNFGNCETNISREFMASFQIGDLIEISTENGSFIAKYGETYSSVESSENVSFISTQGRLTIAVNYGNLANRYNLKSGDIIQVKKAKIIAGILRYNSSELVDNIIKGMKASLTAKGFVEGINIEYIEKNPMGDISKYPSLINELIDENVDIVIPVSTPASKAAVIQVPVEIPIVYTYVTSPEFAGLIDKRSNVTGLSDATNFDDYLEFAKELVPDMTVAGRIYNPSEPNSAFSQDKFLTLGSFYGITYQSEVISNTQQINSAYNLLRNNDIKVILIAADNTVNLGMKNLADLCKNDNIILIGDSDENVTDGALASISVDYTVLANATGVTVGNVLFGQAADSKPIQRFPTSSITLNKITANKIGFVFNEEILSKASKIIQ
jgi:ABC-type uncharacterized transport system substrate-binding protein/S-adenosylmethionine hydrolase